MPFYCKPDGTACADLFCCNIINVFVICIIQSILLYLFQQSFKFLLAAPSFRIVHQIGSILPLQFSFLPLLYFYEGCQTAGLPICYPDGNIFRRRICCNVFPHQPFPMILSMASVSSFFSVTFPRTREAFTGVSPNCAIIF